MARIDVETLVNEVAVHLAYFGIAMERKLAPPATLNEVSQAEASIGAMLPEELRALYLEYANGFYCRWAVGNDFQDANECGSLEIPSLPKLVSYREPYVDFWMCSLDVTAEPCFRNVDRNKVQETIARMQHWLPFCEEACGDQFCIDLRDSKVVYNEHDWFDGGDGTNGHILAATFAGFITKWARVCFTSPISQYWPDAFTPDGIDWTSVHFDARYIID